MNGHAATTEAELEAEVSADRAGRRRVSRTGASICSRDLALQYSDAVGGGLSVERPVDAVEPFDEGQTVALSRGQDKVLAFDQNGETKGH